MPAVSQINGSGGEISPASMVAWHTTGKHGARCP
jgi:hypothetical protein